MADRSVEQIRADLAAKRAKLASATSEAIESVKPINLARNGAEQVKTFAKTEINTAFAYFRNEDGSLKVDRLFMLGGAVVGAVVLAASIQSIAARRTALTHQVRKELVR